jgi:iron complex outermembrane receptor protein
MGLRALKVSSAVFAASALALASLAPHPARGGPAEEGAAAAQSTALEEVTVTARRRSESLHDTPVAVSALPVSQLEDRGSLDSTSLQGSVPNLLISAQNSGAAAANLAIRGLAFADVEKSFEPTVGIAIDGVFLGTSTGQIFDFFDISGLEVLRGPQGTLFGANTIGGVINITRSRPTGELGVKAQVGYGSFDSSEERIVFNTPLIKDVLAAKLFYFGAKTDGFYHNATTGADAGGSYNKHYGATLLLTPPGTGIDALATVEQQTQDFAPVESNIANSSESFCQFEPANQCNRNTSTDLYTVFSTLPSVGYFRMPAETLQLHFDLGGVNFTSITAYRKSHEDQAQDFDGSSANLYYVHIVQDFHQFSQELRGAGKISNSLDYVIGAYFYNSGYNKIQYTKVFGADLPFPQFLGGTSKSTAGFADFNWQFADQWRASFGGRYTRDEKSLRNTDGGEFLGAPSSSFSKFTPKVGVDYRPADDYMFYASWSVGYRSGGFSNRASTVESTNTPYGPETVDSTEVGAKLEFFDKRLAVNSALFYATYKDMQQTTTIPGGPTGNQTIVFNVGSAVIKGAELEVTARPLPELTLNGALGLLSSHFNDFLTQAALGTQLRTFDYSQVNLIYAPTVTASLGAQYAVPVSFGELRANVGYRHIANYDQQISDGSTTVPPVTGIIVVPRNDPRVTSAAQDLLDASISTVFNTGIGKTRLTLYGRNLTDDRGPAAAFTVAGLWSFASAREPRVFGAQVGFEF